MRFVLGLFMASFAISFFASGCSTALPLRPTDPAGVTRTSPYCVRFDEEAKAYACNTGTMQCVSINGGLLCSPNPAPSASPTPPAAPAKAK